MKRRLITAVAVGSISAAVGMGVAVWQRVPDQMLWIALATGILGFLGGLVFKFRLG